MTTTTLQATANKLAAAGKGILAADMPRWRLEAQLEQQGITPDDGSYRAWCELLFTTPQLSEHISGVIMADDAAHLDAGAGRSLVELVRQKGMIPGITPSKGLVKLAGTRGELIESGLDGLRERLSRYAEMGFGFSKWRSPIRIGEGRPSDCAIAANVYVMGQFAALSQEAGIVPMIEPEVELVGNHTIERCFEVTEGFLRRSFESLYLHRVELEGTLVKASMVLSGADCPMQADVDTVAELTVRVLRRAVPAAIPGITFLSGGQSDFKATAHLNAMNASYETPWALTFSYARALQRQPMALWRNRAENVPAAQAAFKHRAKMNALASIGLWTESLETQMTPG